jgi:hypothetical protein
VQKIWIRNFETQTLAVGSKYDMLAVSIMMKIIKIKEILVEVLLRDASG